MKRISRIRPVSKIPKLGIPRLHWPSNYVAIVRYIKESDQLNHLKPCSYQLSISPDIVRCIEPELVK